MADFRFYSDGKLQTLGLRTRASTLAAKSQGVASVKAASIGKILHPQGANLESFSSEVDESETLVATQKNPNALVMATECLAVEGATKTELKHLKDKYGMKVIREGSFKKALLKIEDEGGRKAVEKVFECARATYKRGYVEAVNPNFIRIVEHIKRKPAAAATAAAPVDLPWWNHLNSGKTGVSGADCAARAAWTLTKGNAEIRVAVLDEGVDVSHPDLKKAVVAQKDFVDGHSTAAPDADDAHGTACAGIIVGRGTKYPGLTECSLVAVRIAKGDGHGHWVFDDFSVADAIDWSWKDGASDVLSNSWGTDPPVDTITNAFERARTKGRSGKGCVIAVAAGNSNSAVHYPATLPEVLCVGASNEWDERKKPTSKDGENWWGSCFGPELKIVAPGVHIATTDIAGPHGYSPDDYILTFNGTSAATPHVAAAAALVLSVAPKLTEKQVRDILTGAATRMDTNGKWDDAGKWNKEMGWGRLNIYQALRRAAHP